MTAPSCENGVGCSHDNGSARHQKQQNCNGHKLIVWLIDIDPLIRLASCRSPLLYVRKKEDHDSKGCSLIRTVQMDYLRTRIGNPLVRAVWRGERESNPTCCSDATEKNDKVHPSCSSSKRQSTNGILFSDDEYLEAVNSDSESTAASSNEVSVDEEDNSTATSSSSSVGNEIRRHYAPSYSLCQLLHKIFRDKSNKTVLLNTSQRKEIHRAIATDYTRILLLNESSVASSGSLNDLEVHLDCAKHILDQFWEAQEMILRTSMAATAQEMLFQTVEDYLIPRFMDQIYPMSQLSEQSTAKAVKWICQMDHDMHQFVPDLIIRKEWSEEREKLVDHYLDLAARSQLRSLLGKLLEEHCEENIQHDLSHHLVTRLPEDILYVFNQQVKVASERLPERYKERVAMLCNEELAAMISQWGFQISANWRDMSPAFSCANINDLSRLLDYCQDRNKLTRPRNVESSEQLAVDVGELSLLVTQLLCKRIVHSLREPLPILDSIGDATWASQDGDAPVDRIIATFKSYLSDFEDWLPPGPSIPRILKYCFDLLLTIYLESFFANTMAWGINDPIRVAAELEQDYMRLVKFFNGAHLAKYHGSDDFYPQKTLNDRVRILQRMAALINPMNPPNNLSFEISEMLASFKERDEGKRAVLHLAAIRQRRKFVSNKSQWLEMIRSVEEALSTRDPDKSCTTVLFILPDISAAKMWPTSWSRENSTPKATRQENRFTFSSPTADRSIVLSSSSETICIEFLGHSSFDTVSVSSSDANENNQIQDRNEYDSDGEDYFEGRTLAEF